MTIHLVHGAWHGSWCWSKVASMLEAQGQRVVARDLPGLGEDRTSATEISLKTYVDSICDQLTEEAEPVLLLGHSMGGIVISEVAERLPDKIRGLVYVSAYLLCDGESIMQLAQEDADLAQLAPYLVSDGVVCTFQPDKIREIFYAHCSDSDAESAVARLVPQPLVAFGTPVHVTPERFGRIPKFYVQCMEDRAVPVSVQQRMLAATPCQQVVAITTDHSPFLSAPEELIHHVLSFCSNAASVTTGAETHRGARS